MKIKNKIFHYETKKELDFLDITDEIKRFIKESKIQDGFINIQCMHTTATVILNENEPLLLKDMKKHLAKIAPKSLKYNHDNFKIRRVNMCKGECANGHSHCKALLMPVNVALNLIKGKLQAGIWQRIFLLELDRKRKRKIQVQIMGK